MSRIKFEKAMRLIGGEFINPLSWWPEWFPPVNLAVLQRPLKDSDTTDLQAAIESDVKAGELVSTPRPYLLRPPVFDLSKDFAEQGIPCDQPTITAPDFAAWLAAQGESKEAIGTHAGIQDTSLLMAVDPKLIRKDKLANARNPKETGVTGDPTRATAAYGRKGLDMIVDTTVRLVRQSIAAH